MNITIRLTYTTRGLRSQRAGTFQLRGKAPEKVAADWIQEIKKEMDVDGLIQVNVNGKEDITDAVKNLIRASFI